ncbi:MAG: RDD family protein [Acholeplasmataceae bacterium]|nr:RDD family protein [Acholeplasmataceae bacterium]
MIPTFEKRVRGFAIDTSAVALFVIISMPLGVYFGPLPYIVSGVSFVGFYFIPHFFTKGQTLGKRFQKTIIVDINGQEAQLWRIFLREIIKLVLSISTFGAYLILSFFFLSEKSSNRTLHDYITKTKVIDLEKPTGKNNFLNKTESMRKRGF